MDLESLLRTKEFLDELSVSIRNIILSALPNMTPQEKEEVDLEVKLKLWRKVARGKKIDNLRSYLWRVVYTTALDLIADRQDYLPIDKVLQDGCGDGRMPEELTLPDQNSEALEYRLELEAAVESLPERRKAVARLYLAGEGIPAIAASLGWRKNQVRHLLYRGLADIRTKMMVEPAGRPAAPEPVAVNNGNKDRRGSS
jgi:RNA polymerase sigma factor (sigma-70 family)